MKNKKDEQWEVLVSHQSDLLTQDMILTSLYRFNRFKRWGLSFDIPSVRYDHGTGDISYPAWLFDEFRNTELSKEQFKALVRMLSLEIERYKRYLEHFKKQIKSPKNKEKKIRRFFEESMMAVSGIPFYSAFETCLNKKLKKEDVDAKDIPSSVTDTTLASLALQNIAHKHQKELNQLKIASRAISSSLTKDLGKFCRRFGYLGMIYFKGNPWSIEEAFRMMFSADSGRNKMSPRKLNSFHANIAAELMKLRTQTWEIMCYGAYLFRMYIKKYFNDDFSYDELIRLRMHEVFDLIEGKYPVIDKTRERESFILEVDPNGVRFFLQEKKADHRPIDTQIQELKGIIAHPGKAKGIVKVILSAEKSYKVQVGDILVAKMSTPDFLPAMKRASAFVTDIGGITSHAAIVSREMKKPCIIGTKIATKVLKDGDMVEVDANKGIVRIIKQFQN